MRISVFGLGYVGCVSAACFCDLGNEVWGVDVDPAKVDFLKTGNSPIMEKDLPELIHKYHDKGTLHATTSAMEAIQNTDISLICVGTPSRANGSLDTGYVQRVADEIGTALGKISHPHLVIVRSTLLPGTTAREILPRLERNSGRKEGREFTVAYNPEFLREGSAVRDFYEPPKTVVGAFRPETAQAAAEIYKSIPGPLFLTRIEEAEMVKYADNVFHAVKIVFGNEVGVIAKQLGVDSHRVMEIFVSDTKLNLSPYYLKPGFAFGGSCLPKDVRALSAKARELDLKTPLIFSLMESNREHIERAAREIAAFGKKKIGLLGLAFKAGTDDLRESPMVELVETLLGKGYKIKIYDKNVSWARLVGSNKRFIEQTIPHLAELLTESTDDILEHAEVILIGNPAPEFPAVLAKARPDQIVYDLVRIRKEPDSNDNYHGICW